MNNCQSYNINFKSTYSTDIDESLERSAKLLGRECGIIKGIAEVMSAPQNFGIFNYTVDLLHTKRFHFLDSVRRCGSSGTTWKQAKMGAIGEAVERYSLCMYNPNNLIRGNYRKLKNDAVNPSNFVLFSSSQYREKDFFYSEFTEDSEVNWTWGYSLINKKPVLVPASFVYLPYKHETWEAKLRDSNSNGAAVGATIEEAILSGLYEVLERDAFSMMWFNRLSLPMVDFQTVGNPKSREIIEKVALSKLKLYVTNITMDIKIPIFFGMVLSDEKPFAAVGAAADLNPERAFIQTLEEVFQTWVWADLLARETPGSVRLNFNDIVEFEYRTLLYAIEDLRSTMDFIITTPSTVKLHDIPDRSSEDIFKNINYCLEILASKGMDVIVVDFTPPDIKETGFVAVKVIVPGLIGINGHYQYRYLGGKRLYEIPCIMGYREKAIKEEELNKYPHPFP